MHHYKHIRSEDPRNITEQMVRQWLLLESLGGAALSWFIISGALFIWSEEASFLSITGFLLFVGGWAAVCYIFGLCIYFTNRTIFHRILVKENDFPEVKRLKRIVTTVNVIWFPVIALVSWYMFSLTYDAVGSLPIPEPILNLLK